MTLAVTALIATGSASVGTTAPEKPLVSDSSANVADRVRGERSTCPYARRGLAFYRERHADWLKLRGAPRPQSGRAPRSCADARYLADIWRSRSFAARQATEQYVSLVSRLTLRDFVATAGNRAWHRAVAQAQRPYPGTEAWLLSCSASEGGHGRWVPNSQGSGVGGWLQFYPSTFYGFYERARSDVRKRGYRVPSSASSWYSPLGQALAGGWAITNGMRHHWVGSGC